jgi:hypothetical protein
MMAEPDEQEGASKVDGERARAGEREGQRGRRHGGGAVQPNAVAIRRLSEASSRKSTLSANSDTEPIAKATANSTPK